MSCVISGLSVIALSVAGVLSGRSELSGGWTGEPGPASVKCCQSFVAPVPCGHQLESAPGWLLLVPYDSNASNASIFRMDYYHEDYHHADDYQADDYQADYYQEDDYHEDYHHEDYYHEDYHHEDYYQADDYHEDSDTE